eukprot:CAMPEP_0182569562 /NCGR_PEP_ID=MMETSP1324-20130603/10156_1 /TAXON_ID=236786 /ORGANISM="Florenciella sp., Strain RCC1587" /LENGTH=112 /DNA_ID=CAMNT_0024783845 /DNA_START=183 /DNA_END=517 /DNA_ORIENTATION=+
MHDVELFILHREECVTVRLAPDPHDPTLHEAPYGSFDELQYSLRRDLQLHGGEHITALRTFEDGHEILLPLSFFLIRPSPLPSIMAALQTAVWQPVVATEAELRLSGVASPP